uniref:DNA-directed RNA polymerase III subunit n=1 Tax=Strigamia maritima TaxID=126957 RepID=T1JDW6_STRMM
MAGRGRGRGKLMISSECGIEKGEEPPPVLQPPPLFPELLNRPLPFDRDISELLRIKKCLRMDLSESESYIKPPAVQSMTERYSDSTPTQSKSKSISLRDNLDLSRFPKELKSIKKKRKVLAKPHKPEIRTDVNINIDEKLKALEKKENEPSDEEDEEKAKEDEENEEIEEEYDEEIEEEVEIFF